MSSFGKCGYKGEALKWGSNEPYGLDEALLSSVGIEIKPKDVDLGYLGWRLEFDKIARDLNAQARSLKRQAQRHMIDDKGFDRAMARLTKKRERLYGHLEKSLPPSVIG